MARANISIIILAMVQPQPLANGTLVKMPDVSMHHRSRNTNETKDII